MQIQTDASGKELKRHGDFGFPFLVSREQLSGYESGSFFWHWHPEVELTFVEKGEMIYRAGQSTFHLREGEAIFTNTNVLHAGEMFEEKDCRYTPVTFDPRLIYGFHNSAVYRKYAEPILCSSSLPAIHFDLSRGWHREVITSVQKLIRLDKEQTAGYEMEILAELVLLWKTIFLGHPEKSPSEMENEADSRRIREILTFLSDNYGNNIRLDDVAGHIHLCTSECSRLFKRYMKVSLFTFLQEYRVERSLEFLADPEMSITDVALQCGFSDSNYYARVFSRIRGCSPRQYRKALRPEAPDSRTKS
ncbi:MAG: AraC family transcriptional regulator [Clostridiales bacterium]|nr:AraC family transcriptional regulator [Clostridiales bacterium]